MGGARARGRRRTDRVTGEPPAVRALLIGVALAFLGLFLVLPLVAVFAEAFRHGWSAYARAFADPDARSAIALT
jgi:sulfate transport system permease protein